MNKLFCDKCQVEIIRTDKEISNFVYLKPTISATGEPTHPQPVQLDLCRDCTKVLKTALDGIQTQLKTSKKTS